MSLFYRKVLPSFTHIPNIFCFKNSGFIQVKIPIIKAILHFKRLKNLRAERVNILRGKRKASKPPKVSLIRALQRTFFRKINSRYITAIRESIVLDNVKCTNKIRLFTSWNW